MVACPGTNMLEIAAFICDRSRMNVDPLSDVLQFVRARCILSGTLVAGGAWATRLAQVDAIKFCAVTEGRCWMALSGDSGVTPLEAGDMIVTNGQRRLTLASSRELMRGAGCSSSRHEESGVVRLGMGEDFRLLGGHVAVAASGQRALRACLPPLIHVQGSTSGASALRWPLEQLRVEVAEQRPGAAIVIGDLAKLLFVQALRAYLAKPDPETVGWLRALADPPLALVLGMMHGDPARHWTLTDLAKAAAMSRTAFSVRFKSVVGTPPMAYLMNWRMHLADRALSEGTGTVGVVAASLGYSSESAFNTAFRRVMGVPPGSRRRRSSAVEAVAVLRRDTSLHHRL